MKNIIKFGLFSVLMFSFQCAWSQQYSPKDFEPTEEFENIHVQEIHSTPHNTTFVIWVKQEVKAHKHLTHTETIMILSGKGLMTVGGVTRKVKKGDLIIVPAGVVHSVVTSSRKPLQVISIQAPVWDGKDRIFIKE